MKLQLPTRRILELALERPRFEKQLLALAIDAMLVMAAAAVAYYLRLGIWVYPRENRAISVAVAVVLAIGILGASGTYHTLMRHSGAAATGRLVRACFLYGCIYASIFTYYGMGDVPRTIGILQPIVMCFFLVGWRLLLTSALASHLPRHLAGQLSKSIKARVVIYGAGNAGQQLSRILSASPDMKVVGFLDDDRALQRHFLNGTMIYDPTDLPEVISRLSVDIVLLAIPSTSRKRRAEILETLRGTSVRVHTLPAMSDIVFGRIKISDLRELDIEDLLGRDPVDPDMGLMTAQIEGKVVLVTGAGGSIGSELSRQILRLKPAKLLLVDCNEFNLYSINGELEREAKDAGTELLPLIASVVDEARMADIFDAWKPSTVYHAAAYKHVPLVEHNVVEGVRNNTFGTLVVAQAAMKASTENFVLISTDKAVRPTNVMGTSKRLAEMVLQSCADHVARTGVGPRFSMVRFGNVLGSSGSVVPLFRKQIQDGGPLTVTSKRMTRYFMTIPEAAQLVLQAGGMAAGGEVFVLDMGQPVQIVDLARKMIDLSGLVERTDDRPDGDIEIVEVGLRPGEKLYEELLIGDNPEPTTHSRILKANEPFIPLDELAAALQDLKTALQSNDQSRLRTILCKLVPGYNPQNDPVDWVGTAIRARNEPQLTSA